MVVDAQDFPSFVAASEEIKNRIVFYRKNLANVVVVAATLDKDGHAIRANFFINVTEEDFLNEFPDAVAGEFSFNS